MKQYFVADDDELDNFDYHSVSLDHEFMVHVYSTGKSYYPVWCVRQNGDIDGLEGWNEA